jgi:uncharacterized protein YggE
VWEDENVPDDPPESSGGRALPTVTVRGEAVIRAEPDEAALWISVTALEDSPGKALADVARRSDAIMSILDSLEVAKADRATTGVRVQEEFDHTSKGRRSLGHRAGAGVSVRFTGPELIGPLISRVTDDVQASVAGPRWYVSLSNPLRLQAAELAAADARRKAEAYAAGVDARLGHLIKLSEPDSQSRGIAIARRGLHPMAAEAAMPIEPGEEEVVAAIDATFALEL